MVLAHGVGGRQDLPLPFELTVIGAAAALLVSFVALGALWREPRLNGPEAGRVVPAPWQRAADSSGLRLTLGAAGLVAAGYVGLALVAGQDNARNPVPFVVYVLLWVGLVPASVVLGPVWRWVNPVRWVHALLLRAAGLDPRHGVLRLPSRLGYWPAAVGLFAFTWLELIAPDNATLPVLQLAVLAYVSVQLTAALLYGSRWLDRGDPFEVWSRLYGRLSVLGRRADGRVVLRSPLAGLDAVRPAPGLVAVLLVMLASTAYDALANAPWWFTLVQSSPVPATVVETAGLLAVAAALGLVYGAATRAAGVLGGRGGRGMPTAFAHSLVPIACGYVIAHYFSLLVLEGQRAFVMLSDPLGTGADWLGLKGLQPDVSLLQPTLVACVQVLSIVTGHVLGVVLAHDRAVRLFPRTKALVGQLPLLVLMVTYTCGGLLLLFGT